MSNGFDDFYAIIPAGGTGTRLWPLSREAKPKFLFDLLGSGRTLIQSTFDRLAAIAGMGLAPLWVSDMIRESVTGIIAQLMS